MNIVFYVVPSYNVPGVADIRWDNILSLTCKRKKKPNNVMLQHWKCTHGVSWDPRDATLTTYIQHEYDCVPNGLQMLWRNVPPYVHIVLEALEQSGCCLLLHSLPPLCMYMCCWKYLEKALYFRSVWQKEHSGKSRRISLTHLCRIRGFKNTKGTRENDLMLPFTHITAHHCNILSSTVAISNSFPRWGFSFLSFFLRLLTACDNYCPHRSQ